MINFTFQDLIGSLLAFMLFPLVMLFPGYVVGWALNVFDFRSRIRPVRYLIGIVLSNAFLPIFAFLIARFWSANAVLTTLLLFAGIFIIIDISPLLLKNPIGAISKLDPVLKYRKTAFIFGLVWVVFSFFLLLDLQMGNRLYFPTVSYDSTSRIPIIDAITRTGIPPINPGYFPGRPQQLTFLYYYWYIPESLVDQLAGNFVNSRQAMLAGVTWTGLCLMATVALYLRLRNHQLQNPWSKPLIGVQLLLVSGVDFIPVVILAVASRKILGHMMFNGQVESWNMPIASWLNATTWVPDHVAAATQCITAMLAILSVYEGTRKQRLAAGFIAALAFASALGTSVFVTLVFAVAWIMWELSLVRSKSSRELFWIMGFSSVLGLILSIPFIRDLLKSGGTSSASSFPFSLYVRPFILGSVLLPEKLQPIANLLALPLNYFLELGFFFVLGLYWIKHRKDYERQNGHFFMAEVILLATVTILLTFIRSTLIDVNIFGIRPWLLGQFILLIWATDVLQGWLKSEKPRFSAFFRASRTQPRIGRTVQFLLLVGLLTTGLEAFSTRLWPMLVDWNIVGFPNDLSPDRNLGARTYDARLAYDFVNKLPAPVIAQYNPGVILDRPSGLYGTIQFAVSDRTAYGVPQDIFQSMKAGISGIFERDDAWLSIDQSCTDFSINTLVVNDLDPLWKQLAALQQQRKPLYQNDLYAVVPCGVKANP